MHPFAVEAEELATPLEIQRKIGVTVQVRARDHGCAVREAERARYRAGHIALTHHRNADRRTDLDHPARLHDDRQKHIRGGSRAKYGRAVDVLL